MRLLITCLFTLSLLSCKPTTPEVFENVTNTIQEKACTKDLKACPDGQSVGRNSKDQCNFHPCPTTINVTPKVTACPDDVKLCADGSQVTRNLNNHCNFYLCKDLIKSKPEPMLCTQDVKQCADGSYVGRDPLKQCAFKPCKSGEQTNLE